MKMTLDEAIKHCHEKAEEIWKANEEMPTDCKLSEDLCECANEHEQLAAWLEELAERREADRWISVSERLPEESNFYLVTIADKYTTYVSTLFFMISTADMWEHDKRVVAWKPLPKPYESEAVQND